MKVNKRIGKLKQWTGEKLGAQHKTEVSEDFQFLEQDVELRKAGVEKLYSVSKEFSKHLTKKVEAEGTDTGKLLPIDGLGVVCANHGEEFGHESALGRALCAFGKAQQQMAISTANFTDFMHSGWLTSLEKSLAQMSEYTAQRKKLDSRRLTYDAMLAKVQKSKKEKRELEDDLRVAKNRYEETSEEVQERAIAIQDAESDQMVALSRFLEIESAWIDEQKRILDDVKRNWGDPSAFKVNSITGSHKKGTAHSFGMEPSSLSKPSIRGKLPLSARRSRTHGSEDEADDGPYLRDDARHDYDDGQDIEITSRHSRRQPKPASAPPYKPRSAQVTPGAPLWSAQDSFNRFGGVRIPGMPASGSSPNDSDGSAASRTKSGLPLRQPKSSSPPVRRSTMAACPSKSLMILKAKWAYDATESDELSLSVGDRVQVTSQVNGEWFIGINESTGRSGMFPAAYCFAEDSEPMSLMPQPSDTFADPEEVENPSDTNRSEEDESEAVALRPSASSPLSSVTRSHPQNAGSAALSKNISNPPSGKRAPPPPPSRRVTAAGSVRAASAPSPNQSFDPPGDQPEAFGSVSELKKRLGMFK